MKRTPMLKTSEESAWLFHEIGRAYWELSEGIWSQVFRCWSRLW